jgi:hypothetical protein
MPDINDIGEGFDKTLLVIRSLSFWWVIAYYQAFLRNAHIRIFFFYQPDVPLERTCMLEYVP